MKKKLVFSAILFCVITTSQGQFLKKITGKKETDTTKVEKKVGGGLFQNIVAKVAKVAGNAAGGMAGMVSTVDNLENVDILASIGTNIYSKKLGLVVNDFLGDDWIDNGDFTMIMLSSKNSFQLNKYAGSIKVNNKELKHSSYGVHTVCENPNSGNKKISFEKNGIVEGSFEVPAPKNNIKLLTINGQKDNVNIDLTKDVVLEFSNYSTTKESLLRIDIIASVIGIRSLYLVTYVKPAAKVVIPFQAFRNIETMSKGLGFSNCYLSVSDQLAVKTINNTGFFKSPIDALTGSNDGMWINVTQKPEQFYGISIENKTKTTEVTAQKKNAAYSMPLSKAQKITVASLSIEGTTYSESSKVNAFQQTETTKTIEFPQIPDAWQEATLVEMHKNITATTGQILGGTILPVEIVTQAPSYNEVQNFFREETNTSSNFLRAYKGLNPIKPLSTSSLKMYGENALLSETKSDALLKIKMVLELSWDSKPLMTPFLYVTMDGASNGAFRSASGNTNYFTIKIKGEPYEIKKGKVITPDEYVKITQVALLNQIYKETLSSLKQKELEKGDYEVIWNLQK
ncbi:hypothetical protein C3L50_13235 [Flavobacterium alvei]|uniref:Uncharacterized protein n=1 Tax=Flavobacterium alvei TaxID=2080416 RepID=A0A2S5A6L0_9FLAO|nr:hypothetical protein [Flavobacterium alvei]POY38220.1 hypothetical protein C3L50_13235 [Flavobacterium alvei]